jgi:hypothetical protein
MSVVPRERAGSGSALTNTARQVAGALGVAVLGSILAQVYRGQLSPHLPALPAAARTAATGSITGTDTVAAGLGRAGLRLDQFGDVAFVHAMHVTTAISAVITLVGALVVLIWMPGRAAVQTAAVQPQAEAPQAEPVLADVALADVALAGAAQAEGGRDGALEIPAAIAAEAGVES